MVAGEYRDLFVHVIRRGTAQGTSYLFLFKGFDGFGQKPRGVRSRAVCSAVSISIPRSSARITASWGVKMSVARFQNLERQRNQSLSTTFKDHIISKHAEGVLERLVGTHVVKTFRRLTHSALHLTQSVSIWASWSDDINGAPDRKG